MSAQSNQAPVIIKRKKIIADEGHHGGAWKVAMRIPLPLTLLRQVSLSPPPGSKLRCRSDICRPGLCPKSGPVMG